LTRFVVTTAKTARAAAFTAVARRHFALARSLNAQ